MADPTVPALPQVQDTVSTGELATTMVLRGAVGTLIGAAVAPRGNEGIWGTAGFVSGALLGDWGIVALSLMALWKKTDKS
jgi:hypothetical protein